MRKKLKERGGISLLEVLIAAAILAVASLMLFMTIQTMAGITIETERRKEAAAELAASIAYGVPGGGENNTTIARTEEQAQFSVAGIEIRGTFTTYTTEDGQGFTVFEAQR